MSLAKRFGLVAALEEIEIENAVAEAAENEAVAEGEAAVEGEEAVPAAAEVAEEVVEVEEVEIPMVEDSLEEALGETEVASQEIEVVEQTIEAAQDDSEVLSQIADKMEESAETGGLDAAGAAVATVAIEHLMSRLGLEHVRPMPAMESFGGDSSRKKATQFAVENIREQLKTVAQAIIAMVKKAYEFIKAFVKSALDANTRLKTRAETMMKALDGVKGVALTDKVEGGFVNQLDMGGKVDAKAALLSTTKILGLGADLTGEVFAAAKPGTIVSAITDSEQFAAFQFKGFDAEYLKSVSTEGENGYNSYTVGDIVLPNKTKLIVSMKKDAEAGQESMSALANVKVSLESDNKSELKDADVLTIEEAKAIVKAVIDQCDKVAEMKDQSDAVEKFLTEIISEVKKTSAAVKDDVAASARVKSVNRVLVSLSSVATRPMVLTAKVALTVSKAAIDYVAKSAKAYGVAEVVETAPEATDAKE